MADYCDWEPCSWLQKFVISLLPRDRNDDTVQVDVIQRPSKINGRVEVSRRMTFYYCPFCGTRLYENKEVMEWIHKKRGPPS